MKSWIRKSVWTCLAGSAPLLPTWAAQPPQDPGVFAPGAFQMAAKGDADLPLSKDDLFGDPPPAKKPTAKAGKAAKEAPSSKDALFEMDTPAEKKGSAAAPVPQAPATRDALFEAPPAQPLAPAQADANQAPAVPPPASKDALFDLPPEKPAVARESAPAVPQSAQPEPAATARTEPAAPTSPVLAPPLPAPSVAVADPAPAEPQGRAVQGFLQMELARTLHSPAHLSKSLGRLELGTSGKLENGMRWKLSGRADLHTRYEDFNGGNEGNGYIEFTPRENYLDYSVDDWEFRLGRQHIVWGEMVGMFIADVVSAKDMRDFILPDFQVLRIPQWAARAEYFKDDFHAELVWIPVPSYDKIGRQGASFYPYPPSIAPTLLDEDIPARGLSEGNFGLRLNQLHNGWDLSGFLYSSMDSQQTFYRDPVVLNRFTPRHDRIWQAGGSLAKDFGDFVLKGEAVYTDGRKYNVTNLTDPDGLVAQDTLDWALGLDFNPNSDTRLNAQIYQRAYFDHSPDIIPDQYENGYSLLVNYKLPHNWEAEALWVRSLNRNDWMLRPKLTWGFERNWRMVLGLDLFHGPVTAIFGQYDDNDRAYVEVRYDF